MNWLIYNLNHISRQALAGFKLLPKLKLKHLKNIFINLPQSEFRLLIITLIIAILTGILSINFWLNKTTKIIAADGGNYTEGVIGKPQFINPVLMSSDIDKSLVNLIFSGLYKYDQSGNVVPNLAEGYPSISEDKKTYTINMKQASWHNGLPVTPSDVVFTIQTIQNPEYKSPRRGEWLSTTVEQTGDHTLVFKLKDASAPFLNNLTLPILSQSVWGKISPDQFMQNPGQIEAIGSGPYQIAEIKKQRSGEIQSIQLKAFRNNLSESQPYLNNVSLIFYKDSTDLLKGLHGKQITGLGFNQFSEQINVEKSAKNLNLQKVPLPQYQAIFLNTEKKLLGDNRIRKALNFSVDTGQILNDVYDGNGNIISGPILKEQVANLPAASNDFSLDQAKSLLEQAGWVYKSGQNIRSKNGTELTLQLVTNDNDVNVKTAQLLANNWKQIGVKLNINILPTKELIETKIVPRDYDLLLFVQKLGPDPDLFAYWHSSQTKSPGLNLSNYNNQTIDSLINQARSETDKSIRDGYYLQILEIMKNDVPAIFLVQPVYSYAIDKNIKGFNIKTLIDEPSRFYDLPNWYINTRHALK